MPQPSGGHLEMRVGVEEYPTAVSFDGQRFVAIEAVESPANQRQAIHVWQNWHEEFRDHEED